MADELFEREISRVFAEAEWREVAQGPLVGPDGFLLAATEALARGAVLVAPATVAGRKLYKRVSRWASGRARKRAKAST